jgi:hypothetical protein
MTSLRDDDDDEDECKKYLKPYFTVLQPNDAKPNLFDLSVILTIGKIIGRAEEGWIPDILKEKGLDPNRPASDDAIRARDQVAAAGIDEYLKKDSSPESGRLLMWGERHLSGEVDQSLNWILPNIYGRKIHVATKEEMEKAIGN